jgi:hypothetical protein
MLKLNPDPTFEVVVNITVPGKAKPEGVKMTFKYRGKKELNEFWEGNKGRDDADIFMDIVTEWGVEAEYTKENVELFLNNYPAAAGEIALTYSKQSLESRVKN